MSLANIFHDLSKLKLTVPCALELQQMLKHYWPVISSSTNSGMGFFKNTMNNACNQLNLTSEPGLVCPLHIFI